jgi:hypothetical protein
MALFSASQLAAWRTLAARALVETCTVTRATGTGVSAGYSTVATGVACRWVPKAEGTLRGVIGGIEAVSEREGLFLYDQDIVAQDHIADSTGRRWLVQATDRGRSEAMYLHALLREGV